MSEGIGFAAPERFVLLVAAAALVVAYVVTQVRRARRATRYADRAMLPALVPRRVGPWRHAIAAVFLLALSVGTAGAAQPTVPGEEERDQATVIVAIDVSDSMGATDVRPDRITAAVAAARRFVGDLPSTFDVGLVTAGSSPRLVVAPTRDHQAVQAALGGLDLSPGTALGDAIFTSLAALPPDADPADGPSGSIILLSDGVTTAGRPDAEAIEAAAEAGVPVSTIAFGTDDATVVSQGIVVDVPVDESALRAIADGTDGTFFEAASGSQLRAAYEALDAQVTVVATDRDIAEWFAGAAFVLLAAAVLASMLTTARASIA